MIEQAKILREIRWLEKEVDGMKYPTKTAFKKAINEFEKRLIKPDEEISIPECLRREI